MEAVLKKLKNPHPELLVWIDLEMTGLDISRERIIEVACIITDYNLQEIDSFGPIVIHQDKKLLDNMNPWCVKHHGESGLTQKVLDSKITEQQCEQDLLKFIKRHVKEKRLGILAGNSVHADKVFIDKYFKSVSEYLHYRIIDVSSIKQLASNWYGNEKKFLDHKPQKKLLHRAMDDIRESIQELKFYKQFIFVKPENL